MMIRIGFLLSLLLSFCGLFGQELNCSVRVDGQQVQTNTNTDIFKEMGDAFSAFMSDRTWTDDDFKNQERINCNIIITISESPDVGSYKASVQIISARPAYKSTYESILLNFADEDWDFEYIQGQAIYYTPNSFTDNISSLLAFYAYIIIGIDYDSFSELGGTEYINEAWEITSIAQASNKPGWNQFGARRSRYWLVENLRNLQLEEVRKANYLMHRKGIDLFSTKQDEGRQNVLDAIKKIQSIQNLQSNAPIIRTFFDTKSSELAKIFSEGDQKIKREAYDILTKINPGNTTKYEDILN